jgi:hypothetical protein
MTLHWNCPDLGTTFAREQRSSSCCSASLRCAKHGCHMHRCVLNEGSGAVDAHAMLHSVIGGSNGMPAMVHSLER